MTNKLFTVCEVAAILRVHEKTVRGYLIDRLLFGYRIPSKSGFGSWRISEEALKCFLEGKPYSPPEANWGK